MVLPLLNDPFPLDADPGAGLDVDRDLAEAFDTLGTLLPLNSRDWAADPLDALVYALFVGWDCEDHAAHPDGDLTTTDATAAEDPEHAFDCSGPLLDTVAAKFNWAPDRVTLIRRYRTTIAAAARGR